VYSVLQKTRMARCSHGFAAAGYLRATIWASNGTRLIRAKHCNVRVLKRVAASWWRIRVIRATFTLAMVACSRLAQAKMGTKSQHRSVLGRICRSRTSDIWRQYIIAPAAIPGCCLESRTAELQLISLHLCLFSTDCRWSPQVIKKALKYAGIGIAQRGAGKTYAANA
jgi:hypothetical protein